MKNILVSGASGIVGYGILKSLRQGVEKFNLIGTTIYSDSIALAFCNIFEQAPMTNDPGYIDWLCHIIKKHNVDMIIPGIEADMYKWRDNKEFIERSGTKILLNNIELIDVCKDKWLFYEELKKNHSLLAIESRIEGDFSNFKNDFGLPFLLKPRRGFASKGIVKVDSKDIFDLHKENLGVVLMAQPIVGSNEDEYTTSAFFDNKSVLHSYMTLRRKLSNEGFTEKAQVTNLAGIEEAIKELALIFKPIGPTNFQFRVDNNKLKLLEINPRISSATSIRAAFGYNESKMSVEYFLNDKVPDQPVIKSGVAIRYIEEHIVYDRDNF
ncbi:carbamoyl-phosphate synthase large subunit [Pelosinus propionicus DSM 13327]|uniref:Carbamoyl-phosphate synthase large subunit n=2 Tax=Pelosinus TaxID=365348 RepID=A0A1I4HT07_9FIRM|nr:carbamoyl-phosphate synthase large subunit [Pelosinus propionicus DSM 13327]